MKPDGSSVKCMSCTADWSLCTVTSRVTSHGGGLNGVGAFLVFLPVPLPWLLPLTVLLDVNDGNLTNECYIDRVFSQQPQL